MRVCIAGRVLLLAVGCVDWQPAGGRARARRAERKGRPSASNSRRKKKRRPRARGEGARCARADKRQCGPAAAAAAAAVVGRAARSPSLGWVFWRRRRCWLAPPLSCCFFFRFARAEACGW